MTDRVKGTEKAERERLLQELAREAGEAGYCNIPALREYLEAAFEAGRSSGEKWVSVEERLPENGVHVLVVNHRGYYAVAVREGDSWLGVWNGRNGPTYWQPLPAPPDSGDKPKGDGRG